MKKILMLGVAGALMAAVPAQAETTSTATATPTAEQQCRTERTQMGETAFKALYGTNANKANAFGKCVSKRSTATTQATATAQTNASKACDAEEQADPSAFAKKYGTGKKGANAHGKCVSGKAKELAAATVTAQVKADVRAALACRTEQKANAQAFATKYGTNANKRNAFGKCVSGQAKTKA